MLSNPRIIYINKRISTHELRLIPFYQSIWVIIITRQYLIYINSPILGGNLKQILVLFAKRKAKPKEAALMHNSNLF